MRLTMDTDIKIGKVKDYNKFSGVGEIVTIDDTYIFTLDNLVDCNIDNGDIVKFRAEKVNDKKLPEVGQILVFNKDDKIVVNRIIEVVDINGTEKIYYTKGDNNDSPDGYPIETKDILGVVKTRIRYIGIPSVFLGKMIK